MTPFLSSLSSSFSGPLARNYGGSWQHRRRIIYVTLLFCAFCVLYFMYKGGDSELSRSIVNSAFLLAGAVVGSYVFGAVWDDQNLAAASRTGATTERRNETTTEALVNGTAQVDDPDKPIQ